MAWGILLAACVALLAHHQALWNDFVNLDDQLYVTSNDRVLDGLTFANAAWSLTAFEAYNWHPLTWLSHMLDVSVWGRSPGGHHLTSVLLHALNAGLVFVLLARLTGSVGRSLVVSLLFATHPLHVESVAWVAERKDVLYAGLFLGSLLAYGWRARSTSAWAAAASLALGAAAMMAKPMAITLPLVLVLLDLWPLGRIAVEPARRVPVQLARAALAKWPWAIMAAVTAYLAVLAQHRAGTGAILYESPFADNVANATVSFVRYLVKAFWPADLAVLYPWDPGLLTAPYVVASLGVVVGLSAFAWTSRRSRPWFAFGWAWFIITLLPVIGVLRFGRQSIADRYTYLPLLGIYVCVVWGAGELLDRVRASAPARAACVAAVCCALAVLTVRQGMRWRNSITLFDHTVRVTRDNALAYRNLANAYASIGDLGRASEAGKLGRLYEARDIVEYQPAHPIAHYRLGNAYAEMGRHPEAVIAFRRSLELKPDFAKAWNNLGVSEAQLGLVDDAAEAFERALALDPGYADARSNLDALRTDDRALAGRPALVPR